MATVPSFLTRHRGPYVFQLIRPHARKPGFIIGEWLDSESSSADVVEEGLALLNDPRDTVTQVHIWSVKEAQFVHTLKKDSSA